MENKPTLNLKKQKIDKSHDSYNKKKRWFQNIVRVQKFGMLSLCVGWLNNLHL